MIGELVARKARRGAPIFGIVLFTMIFVAIPAIVVGLIDGLFGGVREGWILRVLLTPLLLAFAWWVVLWAGIVMLADDFLGKPGVRPLRSSPALAAC